MRKLASIRQISEIRSIPNADNLELAIIDGWQAVVKKGEYKPGDTVIYCEIDSFLPVRPEYEFLRNSCYRKLSDGKEGFRIKTIKLRGQISQGLVLPTGGLERYLGVGDDVTAELGITHYDAQTEGSLPGFIPSTTLERIQNINSQLPDLIHRSWTITEKLDGISFTAYWYKDTFGICSKKSASIDSGLDTYFRAIINEYKLENSLKGTNLAIQGEIVGPGIRKNKYGLDKRELYVFNVFNIKAQGYLNPVDAQDVADSLGLKFVPVISSNLVFPETTKLDYILSLAEDKSMLNSKTEREGLVLVSDDIYSRISFKVISNKFLLKSE